MFASGKRNQRLGIWVGARPTFHCKPLGSLLLIFMLKIKKIMKTADGDKVVLTNGKSLF